MNEALTILDAVPACTVINTRIMPAPKDQVFSAWAEPDLLKKWWGPNGFSNSFHLFDFSEGGRWSFIMHGPDGRNYPNESQFVKINPPELIVLNHLSNPKFQVQASFEELPDDRTRLGFTMIFPTEEECNALRAFVHEKNEENFNRLEAVLSGM